MRSSKVSLIVSFMLCFVSLLHTHFIKCFQREHNLETVILENELWFVEAGSWSQLCLFQWGRGRVKTLLQFSCLQRDRVFLLIYNEAAGNKHIMVRKFPVPVKCYGYLCMFTGLQSTGNTHLERAEEYEQRWSAAKKTNCRDVRNRLAAHRQGETLLESSAKSCLSRELLSFSFILLELTWSSAIALAKRAQSSCR